MSGDAASPSVKDLPKISDQVKDGIVTEHKLRHTEVVEKNVLPTAEDLKAEKAHEGLLKGVEEFTPDKLKHCKTREPASATEVMQVELAHDKTQKEVSEFDKSKLKHAETQEKNPLPDQSAIKAEAEHQAFKSGIETFDKDKLGKTETVEKNILPSKEDIEKEKST